MHDTIYLLLRPQQHVMLTPSMHQAGHGLETQTISDSQSQIPIRPAFNPVAVNTRFQKLKNLQFII